MFSARKRALYLCWPTIKETSLTGNGGGGAHAPLTGSLLISVHIICKFFVCLSAEKVYSVLQHSKHIKKKFLKISHKKAINVQHYRVQSLCIHKQVIVACWEFLYMGQIVPFTGGDLLLIAKQYAVHF